MRDALSSPPFPSLTAKEVRNMIRTLQEKKAQQRVNDFIEFAAQGKWENMETMLKNNKVTVDGRNWDSRTALHIAVCEGRLRIVERLVSESWAQTVSSLARAGLYDTWVKIANLHHPTTALSHQLQMVNSLSRHRKATHIFNLWPLLH